MLPLFDNFSVTIWVPLGVPSWFPFLSPTSRNIIFAVPMLICIRFPKRGPAPKRSGGILPNDT